MIVHFSSDRFHCMSTWDEKMELGLTSVNKARKEQGCGVHAKRCVIDHKIKLRKEESRDRVGENQWGWRLTVQCAKCLRYSISCIYLYKNPMSSHYYYFHFRDEENQSSEWLSNLPKVMQISRLELVQSGSGAILLPQPSQGIWIRSFHTEHTLLTPNVISSPKVLYSEGYIFSLTRQKEEGLAISYHPTAIFPTAFSQQSFFFQNLCRWHIPVSSLFHWSLLSTSCLPLQAISGLILEEFHILALF